MKMKNQKPYQPSNGTEGCEFQSKFCDQCKHEKFTHTQNHEDKQCEIFNNAFLFDLSDENYPKQWIVDKNGNGTCTAFKKHIWRDDYTGELIEPDGMDEINDPNQIKLF